MLAIAILLVPSFVCAVSQNYGFKVQRPIALDADPSFQNYRVFHPAFPFSIRKVMGNEEATKLLSLSNTLSSPQEASTAMNLISTKLPWRVLPALGALDGQNAFSRSQLQEAYNENRHHGMVMWARPVNRLEPGAVLLNHWTQQAVLVTSYSAAGGAQGEELITTRGAEGKTLSWPPLALDFEVADNKWQPVLLSDKYFEALPYLAAFPKGAWELAFLLLLGEEDAAVSQALFDTGLCPQQGMCAYLRVVDQLMQRTEQWDDVPAHRKITEKSILKQ